MSKSERDRDLKESILYSYIRSQEFTNRLEQISRIHEKVCNLQDREERDHQKMWNERKEIFRLLDHAQSEITMRVQTILTSDKKETKSNDVPEIMTIQESSGGQDIIPGKIS